MQKALYVGLTLSVLLFSGCSLFKVPQSDEISEEESIKGESQLTEEPQTKNKLDLSNQALEKIPEYVFKQTTLEELDVSGNELTGAIQAEIRHLQALKVLRASNNQMTGVPAEIGQLRNLEILDLSQNLLTGLPLELGNLKNLKEFNISGNQYAEMDMAAIEKSLPPGTKIIK